MFDPFMSWTAHMYFCCLINIWTSDHLSVLTFIFLHLNMGHETDQGVSSGLLWFALCWAFLAISLCLLETRSCINFICITRTTLFLFSFTLSCFYPILTCGYLCLRVLHPGFKRNTVWTQQMPSKFLAASWLHGMEFFNSHFLWALKLCIAEFI